MQNVLLISIFGLVGVLSRYGIDRALVSWNENFPFSTFIINIVGSFVAGTIYVVMSEKNFSPDLQIALLVGLCGGFTTFSAYALQSVTMIEKGKWIEASTYFIASPILSLIAVAIPIFLFRKLLV